MENKAKKKNLGLGIKIIAALYLVAQGTSVFSMIIALMNIEEYNRLIVEQGYSTVTTGQVLTSLIISIIIVVSMILILLRKAIGVYIFIGIQIISIVYSIVLNGFTINILSGLAMPLLLLFFINKRRDIFFTK